MSSSAGGQQQLNLLNPRATHCLPSFPLCRPRTPPATGLVIAAYLAQRQPLVIKICTSLPHCGQQQQQQQHRIPIPIPIPSNSTERNRERGDMQCDKICPTIAPSCNSPPALQPPPPLLLCKLPWQNLSMAAGFNTLSAN